jgi:hypothetical protein
MAILAVDALIVTLRCRKIYGLQPKLVVTVSPIQVTSVLQLEEAT